MKAYKIFLYLIVFLLFAFSCQQKADDTLLTIPVDVQANEPLALSQITHEMKQISLELTDESLLSDRIIRVLHVGEYIIVADRKNPTPLLFDTEGKFIRKIGAIGQGPQEFNSMLDIAADYKNRRVYISTVAKLICYDFDGKFIKSRPFGPQYINFVHDKLVMIHEEYGEKETKCNRSVLYLADFNLQFTDTIELKTIHNRLMSWVHPHKDFVTENEGNTYEYYFEFNPEPFLRDTLYQLDGSRLVPHLKIDYGTEGVDSNNDRTLYLWNIYRTNRYVFTIYAVSPDKYMRSCYDLKENRGYNMEKGYKDDLTNSGIVDIRPLNTNTEQYYYLGIGA